MRGKYSIYKVDVVYVCILLLIIEHQAAHNNTADTSHSTQAGGAKRGTDDLIGRLHVTSVCQSIRKISAYTLPY